MFFPLGAVLCILPVGFWLFLRMANSSLSADYVNTAKMIEGDFPTTAFTVDGKTYEQLDVSISSLCPKGEAVFSWDGTSGMDRFFGRYDRSNFNAVDNAPCLDLVRADYSLWCRSDQIPLAQAWYGNEANYQWYLQDYNEGDKKHFLLSPQPDREQIAALLAFQSAANEEVEFTVYNDIEIQEYVLSSISTDGVVQANWLSLAVYDGQLCLTGWRNLSHSDTTRTDTAYPLPSDLHDYFSSFFEEAIENQVG